MREIPFHHEKTHDKLKIPEYNFEDGLQRAIEIISSVLEQKDVVVVAINGSDINVGKTTLQTELGRFCLRKGFALLNGSDADSLGMCEDDFLYQLSTCSHNKGVIILGANAHGFSVPESKIQTAREFYDYQFKEKKGAIPTEKIDLWIGIYRDDKPFGSGSQVEPKFPLADILIKNEKAVDK
jgi:hypothetical protein